MLGSPSAIELAVPANGRGGRGRNLAALVALSAMRVCGFGLRTKAFAFDLCGALFEYAEHVHERGSQLNRCQLGTISLGGASDPCGREIGVDGCTAATASFPRDR